MPADVFSPNRKFKIRFDSYEMRMSHSIDQPSLIRVCDNVCLFALDMDDWSAWEVRWMDDSTVSLLMRKYPGLIGCTIELNVNTNEANAFGHSTSVAGDISDVKKWVMSLSE